MRQDVIDASNRFGGRRPLPKREKESSLDPMRRRTRIDPADRRLLAERLGEIAAKQSPDKPSAAAKKWFERAWHGDRWEKRKRFILFPGEAVSDPHSESTFVASGSDWAKLIDEAAQSLFPADDKPSALERERVRRRVLQGTEFLPALPPLPLGMEGAQDVLASLAAKVSQKFERETEIVRLWEILATTPIGITHYDPEWAEDELNAYMSGPLGQAAKLAGRVRGLSEEHIFKPSESYDHEWCYPSVQLGLRGHRRQTRMFVVPFNFREQFRDDELLDVDEMLEWAAAKGLISWDSYEGLPEVEFDEDKGYGWRDFPHKLLQPVWLSIRPKTDSSPGLWVTAGSDECCRYPDIRDIDTLAIAAGGRPISVAGTMWDANFIDWPGEYDPDYGSVEWPKEDPRFLIDGIPPPGAASGVIESDFETFPSIGGWIDDRDNLELQDILFRNPSGTRFCPSIETADDPPPCQAGTVAASIISNIGCAEDDRFFSSLINEAKDCARAGIEFHAALIAYHKNRIDQMLGEQE